jgi:hypothetical protein
MEKTRRYGELEAVDGAVKALKQTKEIEAEMANRLDSETKK